MTDLQQADLNPISLKIRAVTLLAGAIIGSLIGFAAWSLLFANSQAIAVVSVGRYDPGSLIEEPQAVIERIKSTGFASAAAARAGAPELSTLLPARQYGGSGALSVRSLRDVNLLEIRINMAHPELAQKAITAVVDELIAEHSAKIAPLTQNLESTLAALDTLTSEMIKSSDAISKRINGGFQSGEIGKDSTDLWSARALTESGLGGLVKSAGDLRVLVSNVRKSRAITVPTVITPKASSLYQTVAAGTLSGLLIDLLLLQMFPDFFRTVRPGARTRRPAPVQELDDRTRYET